MNSRDGVNRHAAEGGPPWSFELPGSEIARIEQDGSDLIVVLAAARVRGDRRQLDPSLSGGHLRGVRCHLLQAGWTGDPCALIGRIDEADWRGDPHQSAPHGTTLRAPSSGTTAVELNLRTALGDNLVVRALAWRIELLEGSCFTPSLAC